MSVLGTNKLILRNTLLKKPSEFHLIIELFNSVSGNYSCESEELIEIYQASLGINKEIDFVLNTHITYEQQESL